MQVLCFSSDMTMKIEKTTTVSAADNTRSLKRPVGQLGFTLIEVLIVVAILGIIASIAIPSYGSYMTKTRRVDAITLLTEVAGEQQRFFSENNRYAETMTDMGYPNAEELSENGYYNVSVTASTPSSFTVTAQPVAGGAQDDDVECGSFTINSAGQKGVAGATKTAQECW